MAAYTLKAGAHYHTVPPLSTLPWVGKQSMERYVTFSPECAYDSAPYNAQDVNKLFGISFGFGGVHGNSARFGWRWSQSWKAIELLAYVYKEGVRNQDETLNFPLVARVQLGQRAKLSIELTTSFDTGGPIYYFTVEIDGVKPPWQARVPAPANLPSFGLTHGLYFGGELATPHTMAVQIDRP